MKVEVLAVGTELLLGQIADTNGQWLGEHLAAGGLDSFFHQVVGDNQTRIVESLRIALGRSDAVICCGGLGPTQDDITREAIADLMGVPLVRDPEIARRIEGFFAARSRSMPESNLRQADVPEGARPIEQTRGTAPGLVCPVGDKVVYALPGVPHEMTDMFERAVLGDLQARMAQAGEEAVISSRLLRTWGTSESALAEALQPRIDALDALGSAGGGGGGKGVTLAFLASGIEGIKVRITARARNAADAGALLDAEEEAVRAALLAKCGDIVFGTDDVTMEQAVATLLLGRSLTLGVAESLTGGLIASRLVDVPGASTWFRGGVVAYDSAVKRDVLGIPNGPVVSEAAAVAMARGARKVLGARIGLGITGVAGPDPQEGVAPGTVHVGLSFGAVESIGSVESIGRTFRLPGDRSRVRQYSAISALDLLRRTLLAQDLDADAPVSG